MKVSRGDDLLSLYLRLEVAIRMVNGLIAVQSVSGILQRSSDGGRMLRLWSTMRFKGTYL